MSTTTRQEHMTVEQEAIAATERILRPFLDDINGNLLLSKEPLRLSLTARQLCLLAVTWNSLCTQKIIIVKEDELAMVVSIMNVLTKILNSRNKWFVINDTLSPHEHDGTVHTTLSLAYHALLAADTNTIHIINASTFVRLQAPNPTLYQQNILSLNRHETFSRRDLLAKLTYLGFERTNTLSSGTYQVRGEAIDIRSPANTETLTVIFHGEVIEQMLRDKKTEVSHCAIHPNFFPSDTVSWNSLFKTKIVFRPHFLDTLMIGYTVITDAAAPSIAFPVPDALSQTSPLWNIVEARRDRDERTRENIPWGNMPDVIGNLQVGEYAVHADHGIGRYEGTAIRSINNETHEYFVLRYAEGDSLSVPVELAYKLSAYIGGTIPTVHRLGGTLWKRTARKARYDAHRYAQELLSIARTRHQSRRASFTIDHALEDRLEKTFPYPLTEGQRRSWSEIQQDFASDIPMDRLVIGDVGFGKTELAVRAAAHAVSHGHQVAVLAPTTLLVQQHTDTFRERLSGTAIRIDQLSRFISQAAQQLVKKDIASGRADIVIGTHAILGKEIRWHTLGLGIIDEEQRFGVPQKEHFKQMRSAIDVLSLSATPIPRTLSMALAGLYSLSLIDTAPKGRREITTMVCKASDDVIARALEKELARGGQVYAVAPKIRQLKQIQHTIHTLAPKASLAIAHGALSAKRLSSVMHAFDTGKVDILISSNIVENGLDLSNVNTIIVWNAPHFGLADLYQLRGRVGRRDRTGFAYFLYDQEHLTHPQRERLAAITEASRLGSGWELARRDLEIRGAGNLIGKEQSGTITTVGIQLYLDMVRDAIDLDEISDLEIALSLRAILPTLYISDSDERTRWYQRIARAKKNQDIETIRSTLARQFGNLPKETENLLLLVSLRNAARKHGISKISSSIISPPDEDPYARLAIETNHATSLLELLSPMGTWTLRNNAMTLDINTITTHLIQKMITLLAST